MADTDDGSCCASCGKFTDEPGYPRQCRECAEQERLDEAEVMHD